MKSCKPFYLITGSSGFLGRALSQHFCSKGNLVIGLDNEGPPDKNWLFCDLTSDESVRKTFNLLKAEHGDQIKAVFHLAAYYDFSGKDSELYKTLNLDGTRRLLRELKSFEVGQFVFPSSILVYRANKPGERLTEKSYIEPKWQYPRSKVETERLLAEQHGSMQTVIMRIAGIYDDMCRSIPLSHQIQRIYERQFEGHLYSGNFDVRQSFIHVKDIVSAFDASIEKSSTLPKFSVFNIGGEEAMSYKEIQDEIAKLLYGEPWTTIEIPKAIAKAGAWIENELAIKNKPFIKPWMIDRASDNYELIIDKALLALNWAPSTTVAATLPKMIEELLSDPVNWYRLNKLILPAHLKERTASKQAA